MIPSYSSNLKGVVLKIRKMVLRLCFSSRAIRHVRVTEVRGREATDRNGEVQLGFGFAGFCRRDFATGWMIDSRTLNATSASFSNCLRRIASDDAWHNCTQYRHCGSFTSIETPVLVKHLPTCHVPGIGGFGSNPSVAVRWTPFLLRGIGTVPGRSCFDRRGIRVLVSLKRSPSVSPNSSHSKQRRPP
jgi:hypothetical protein